MNSKSNSEYFYIGVFVLIGLGLIIAALLIFGSSRLFRPTVYIETYFDESVQGISVGSAVKYGDIKLAMSIKLISLVKNIKNNSMVHLVKYRSARFI